MASERRDYRTLVVAVIMLLAIVATVAAIVRSRDFQVDDCLDRGGCWDYCNNRCTDDEDRCQACGAEERPQ